METSKEEKKGYERAELADGWEGVRGPPEEGGGRERSRRVSTDIRGNGNGG